MDYKNKTILFDFDGVIVDTFRISYESMVMITKNPPDEEGYRSWFDGNIYEYYDNEKGQEEKYTIEDDDPFFKIYIPKLLEKEPVRGIVSVIKKLHENHRMVVVSSTLNSPIEVYLEKHDLVRHFDKVYGADIHKSKVVKIKMVFADFDVGKDDCVFVTDTVGDIREAAKAGVGSIAITWGFHKIQSLKGANPIAIADSPEALLRILTD